jgi:hypothetical protein
MRGEYRPNGGPIWQIDGDGDDAEVRIKEQVHFGSHPDWNKPGFDPFVYHGPFILTRNDVEVLYRMLVANSKPEAP